MILGRLPISGSRSGAAAVASSLLFEHLGRRGYKRIAESCMAVTADLREALAKIDGIHLYDSPLNVIPMAFQRKDVQGVLDRHEKMKLAKEMGRSAILQMPLSSRDERLIREYARIEKKHLLAGEWLPEQLDNNESHPIRVHKLFMMPHEWIRQNHRQMVTDFTSDIRKLLAIGSSKK